MLGRIRSRRPSYASVTATVALVLALGMGGAYAADKIGSKDVAKGAVKSKHIRDGQVRGADVRDDSLTSTDIDESTLEGVRGPRGEQGEHGEQGPPGPSGSIDSVTAGGDLAGSYPAPSIKDGAVGTGKLASGAVTGAKVADSSVTGADVLDGSLNAGEIFPESIRAPQLAPFSVGAEELKSVTTVVGGGVALSNGAAGSDRASCPSNTQLIAGGFSWRDDEADTIIASAPNQSFPNHHWEVRGYVESGSNVLFAWATCIDP